MNFKTLILLSGIDRMCFQPLGRLIEKRAATTLARYEGPEMHVERSAPGMAGKQFFQICGLKDAPLAASGRKQNVAGEVLHSAFEPGAERDSEPSFRPVEDVVADRSLHCGFQNMF